MITTKYKVRDFSTVELGVKHDHFSCLYITWIIKRLYFCNFYFLKNKTFVMIRFYSLINSEKTYVPWIACLCSLDSYVEILPLKVMILGYGALGSDQVTGLHPSTLMTKISFFMYEAPESSLVPYALWGHKKSATQRKPLPRLCKHPELSYLGFRSVKKRFL